MTFPFSDPQEVENELIIGRYTEEQRSPEIEQFHPVGDLFLDQHQSAIHEGLTEKEETEQERRSTCPDPRGDKGGGEQDGQKDGPGNLVTGHVDRRGVRRRGFQGTTEAMLHRGKFSLSHVPQS